MFNKKGDVGAEEWLEQIPYIILTAVVMIGIFVLVQYYVNLSVNVKPIQREVILNRMMYSANSIMYTDNVTGIVYPGIINLDNFTNQTLDQSITYSYERQLAARLSLYNSEKELIRTAYLNGVWFNRLAPLALSMISGAGSAAIYYRAMPVVYRENGVNQAGFLEIEILIPN
jgi:hypothetical protein